LIPFLRLVQFSSKIWIRSIYHVNFLFNACYYLEYYYCISYEQKVKKKTLKRSRGIRFGSTLTRARGWNKYKRSQELLTNLVTELANRRLNIVNDHRGDKSINQENNYKNNVINLSCDKEFRITVFDNANEGTTTQDDVSASCVPSALLTDDGEPRLTENISHDRSRQDYQVGNDKTHTEFTCCNTSCECYAKSQIFSKNFS